MELSEIIHVCSANLQKPQEWVKQMMQEGKLKQVFAMPETFAITNSRIVRLFCYENDDKFEAGYFIGIYSSDGYKTTSAIHKIPMSAVNSLVARYCGAAYRLQHYAPSVKSRIMKQMTLCCRKDVIFNKHLVKITKFMLEDNSI